MSTQHHTLDIRLPYELMKSLEAFADPFGSAIVMAVLLALMAGRAPAVVADVSETSRPPIAVIVTAYLATLLVTAARYVMSEIHFGIAYAENMIVTAYFGPTGGLSGLAIVPLVSLIAALCLPRLFARQPLMMRALLISVLWPFAVSVTVFLIDFIATEVLPANWHIWLFRRNIRQAGFGWPFW